MAPHMLIEVQIVRALFDYEADGDGRISFSAGEEIQLIYTHDNGWSDGIVRQQRGWFPTDFVTRPAETRWMEPLAKFGWTRSSSTADGIEKFYNTLTGESFAHAIPADNPHHSSPSHSSCPPDSPSSIPSPPRLPVDNIVTTCAPPIVDNIVTDESLFMDGTHISSRQIPSPTDVELELIDFYENDRLSNGNDISDILSHADSIRPKSGSDGGEEWLPLHWGIKSSTDGRKYYYNMITNETTWDKSQIDSTTGKLKTPVLKSTQSSPPLPIRDVNLSSYNTSPASSWDAFTHDIDTALQKIKNLATTQQRLHLSDQAAHIMHLVHQMLLLTNLHQKSSSVLKKYKMLNVHRENMMNVVSCLVLAVKQATGLWPPPDAWDRVCVNANEVLLGVRHFTLAADEAGLSLVWPGGKKSDGSGSGDGNNVDRGKDGDDSGVKGPAIGVDTKTRSMITVTSPVKQPAVSLEDYLVQIDTSLADTTRAIEKFKHELSQDPVETSSLILCARATVTEVGQLLTIMDDIQVIGASNETSSDFQEKKHLLYENISGLVSSTLSLSDALTPDDVITQVAENLAVVEESVLDLVLSSKHVIEALGADEHKELADLLGGLRLDRRGSQLSVRLRRAISMNVKKDRANSSPPDSSSSAPPSGHVRTASAATADPIKNVMFSHGSRSSAGIYGLRRMASSPLATERPISVSAPVRHPNPFDAKFNSLDGDGAKVDEDWFLQSDSDPKDLVVSMEGNVKGATLPVLVEKLTSHDAFDAKFFHAFLMTFRSFAHPMEILKLLIQRFLLEPPSHLSDEQLYVWNEKKLKPIRLRVFNFLKSWLDSFFYPGDEVCISSMKEFALGSLGEAMPSTAEVLLKLIEKREGGKTEDMRKKILTITEPAPSPILPRSLRKIRLMEIDPTEWARQLTLLDSEIYNSIQPLECMNKAWSDKTGNDANNIRAMINTTNKITGWVAESILGETDIKKRCAVMKHFILIADRCRALQNFNTMMAVLAGLNSSPIHRLKRTRDLLSARTYSALDRMKKLMAPAHNFSHYRRLLRSIEGPCVPFLGMYLTDLTFIEDGNPNMLKSHPHLINMDKRMKLALKIEEIQSYQRLPYTLIPVVELQEFLKHHLSVEEPDSELLYQASLQLEPREREDEKIARLLQESGFL